MKAAIYLESAAERAWAKDTCNKKGWEVIDQFDAWTDPEALGYLIADARAGRFQVVVSQTGTYTDRRTDKPVPLADALAGTGVAVHSKRSVTRKPKPAPELPPESQARAAARAAEIRAREEDQAQARRAHEQAVAELHAERLRAIKKSTAAPRRQKPTKAEREYERKLTRQDREENAHKWPCPHCGTIALYGFGKGYNVNAELRCKGCRHTFTPAEILKARTEAEIEAYRRDRAEAEKQEAREAAHRDAFGNWTR